jgi:hypothetical protein
MSSRNQVNRAADDAGSPAELLEMATRFRRHALLFVDDPSMQARISPQAR